MYFKLSKVGIRIIMLFSILCIPQISFHETAADDNNHKKEHSIKKNVILVLSAKRRF